MYKYKQTTDVEVGDLVLWTDISKYHDTLTKDKIYQVTNHPDQNTLNVINDKGNKNSYGKAQGFKVLQTKPADQAVVGDYMYRVTSGTSQFPKHSVIKITEIAQYGLDYSDGYGVGFEEVIVIAQAESEVTYPYFIQSKEKDRVYICKVLEKEKYLYIHTWVKDGNNKIWNIQPPKGEPCDFTIEPEVDDIDWWQARFEAGLPVYYVGNNGYCVISHLSPKEWEPNTIFSMTDPSLIQKVPIPKENIGLGLIKYADALKQGQLGAIAECSLRPTIKEQPMDKTTLKLLLELLGASEEVKDATNSKFVGIITNEDEYVGYMYFDSKEDATECMAQPKMELHKLHLFEKSCVLAQKPRKVIEV